jgi:hypothetical protein
MKTFFVLVLTWVICADSSPGKDYKVPANGDYAFESTTGSVGCMEFSVGQINLISFVQSPGDKRLIPILHHYFFTDIVIVGKLILITAKNDYGYTVSGRVELGKVYLNNFEFIVNGNALAKVTPLTSKRAPKFLDLGLPCEKNL